MIEIVYSMFRSNLAWMVFRLSSYVTTSYIRITRDSFHTKLMLSSPDLWKLVAFRKFKKTSSCIIAMNHV